MSLQVVCEDFDGLETSWSYLLARLPRPTVFLTPLWHRTWWQHMGQGDLCLLAIGNSEKVMGIAPLMQEHSHLSFLGDTDLVDYHDLLLEPGQEQPALTALLDFLGQHKWDSFRMTSLPEGSPTLDLLPGLAQARGLVVERVLEDVCPRLELPATWDDYLAGLTKKDRHELRRKLRRLYGQAEVRHYTVTDPEGVAQGLDDFFRLLRASRQDKAEFLTPQREAFMRAMATALAREGIARLFFLEVSGVRVASALCFYYNGEVSLYNSGYDPAYSSLSVGLLLKALALRDAIELRARAFDFLRGAEPYKYDLGGKDRHLWQITLRPSSA